jgi:hypothetical protein
MLICSLFWPPILFLVACCWLSQQCSLCLLLEYDAVSLGDWCPTLRNNVLLFSSRVEMPKEKSSWTFRLLKMRALRFLETSSTEWRGATFQKDGDLSLLSFSFYSQSTPITAAWYWRQFPYPKYLFNQVAEHHGLGRASTLIERKATVDKHFFQSVFQERNPNLTI